ERERAPRELGLCAKRLDRAGDGGQVDRGEGVERGGESGAPVGCLELFSEAFGCDGAEVKLAVRVAARGEDEHRAAPRGGELGFGNPDVVLDEPTEHHAELTVETRRLELFEASPDLGSRRFLLHSSPT